ncbi:MAG TPA: glycosyltransferase, partial [Phototrophicaceae bacterium]|nr:glycosyltransferase [Phototrophicaceae bacterium]
SDYLEIGKSVLEALLTGLPVVINQHPRKPVAELQGDWVKLIDNTVESYEQALRDLLTNHAEREALGRRAYAHAQAHWSPESTERQFVDIYRSLLDKHL